MKVYEIPIKEENRRLFKVPSASEKGLYYTVQRLKTTAGTIVHKCECIGYVTRAKANPFYECRHIKGVKEYIRKDLTKNKKVNKIKKRNK